MIVFVKPLASLVTVFLYICLFFVFGYVLSEWLPRVFASCSPSTLAARFSCCFVVYLKRKILIQFNDILFQLGLKRFHFRELFCFKAVGGLRVFVTEKEGALIICAAEHATVVNKPFVTRKIFSNLHSYMGVWGGVVFKALRYYSDGPGIDYRWYH